MSDLVAVATHLKSWQAHILKGALEAERIFAAVIGELDYEGGVIQVLVRESDIARALEIKHQSAQP